MTEVDRGKTMILERVTALARNEGIDSSRLLFKWDLEKLVMEEYGLVLDDTVYRLRVFLGKRSQVLSFSEAAIRDGSQRREDSLAANRDTILVALRRLKNTAAFLPPPAYDSLSPAHDRAE